MRNFISNVKPGDRIVLREGTVYKVTRTYSIGGMTAITYRVEGSDIKTESSFSRTSLTSCTIL